jgi:AAA15 family ATPase/GTPase
MGDGTHRVFNLVLSLIRASDGVLLVDEIENGLHYSVLVEVWRALLVLASRLNVQIFATTHSWDCLRAFAEVSIHTNGVDGMLHRLERLHDGKLRTVEFDEDDMALVTRQNIEVR